MSRKKRRRTPLAGWWGSAILGQPPLPFITLNDIELEAYMLNLTPRAEQMLNNAVRFNNTLEVGGFGRVETRNGELYVTDIIVPPQVVQGAHTDISDGDLDDAMRMIAMRGESFNEWRLWWHSHAKMAANPSGTDENTLQMLARTQDSWFAGLVVNDGPISGWRSWLCIHNPAKLRADLTIAITNTEDPAIKAEVDAMMAAVRTRAAYTPPAHNNSGPSWANKNTEKWKPNDKVTVAIPPKPLSELNEAEFKVWVSSMRIEPGVAIVPGARVNQLDTPPPADTTPKLLPPSSEMHGGYGGEYGEF